MKKTLWLMILFFGLVLNVDAKKYTANEIPDYSIVIGTHLYTNQINSRIAMYGALSIQGESLSVDDMIIYYKWGDGDWVDYLSDNSIDAPNEFCISHENGNLIDESCIEKDEADEPILPSEPNKYKVTFKSNDAINYPLKETTIIVSDGDVIPTELIPNFSEFKRLGFEFTYWSLEGNNEEFDFEAKITKDLVLETNWLPITYNINYYNGDTLITSEKDLTFNNGDIELRVESDLDNFAGWSLTKNASVADYNYVQTGINKYGFTGDMDSLFAKNDNCNVGENSIVCDINLYYVETPITYSISYDLNGATYNGILENTNYVSTDITINLMTIQREGYIFKGWSIKDSSVGNGDVDNEKNELTITKKGNIALIANWEAIKYTLKYDYDDENEGNDINLVCEFNQDCILPEYDATYLTEGFEFNGWKILLNDDEYWFNSGDNIGNWANVNGTEVLLEPIIDEKIYTITYVHQSPSGEIQLTNGSETTYKTSDREINLVIPEYIGHKLDSEEPVISDVADAILYDSSNKIVVNDNVFSDLVITLNYVPETYTITYNYDLLGNGENPTLVTCNYGNCELTSVIPETSAYYTFEGWMSSDGYLYNYVEDGANKLNITSDLTLTPKFVSVDRRTISYNLNGGTFGDNEPVTIFEPNALVNLPVPSKEGYDFAGWYFDKQCIIDSDMDCTESEVSYVSDGEIKNYSFENVDSDVSLYAKWTPITYSIVFNIGDVDFGDLDTEIVCTYGEVCSLGDHSRVVFEDGKKKLLGWSKDENASSVYYGDNIELKNVFSTSDNVLNLYPVLVDDYYNVYYNLGDGATWSLESYNAPTYVIKGENLSLNSPVREHYDFAGWTYLDGSDALRDGTSIVIEKDTWLVAKWTPVTYNVDFEIGEGASFEGTNPSGDYPYNTSFVPEVPIRSGYTFEGWDLQSCTTSYVFKFDEFDYYEKNTIENGSEYPDGAIDFDGQELSGICDEEECTSYVLTEDTEIDSTKTYYYKKKNLVITLSSVNVGTGKGLMESTSCVTEAELGLDEALLVTNDMKLVAKWSARILPEEPIETFSVTYMYGDTDISSVVEGLGYSLTFDIDATSIEIPMPSLLVNEYPNIESWNANNGETIVDEENKLILPVNGSDVIINAVITQDEEPVSYTITYMYDGNDVTNELQNYNYPITFNENDSIVLIPDSSTIESVYPNIKTWTSENGEEISEVTEGGFSLSVNGANIILNAVLNEIVTE